MREEDIWVGFIYSVRLARRSVPVHIIAELPEGGWLGRNLVTNREVRIRSARAFRFQIGEAKKETMWTSTR